MGCVRRGNSGSRVEQQASRGFLQPASWSQGSLDARFEAVRPYVEGRTVLDLGCVTGHHRRDWLHRSIVGVASEVVGVDLDRRGVELLNSAGLSLVHANAETVRLDRKFDVVFAGELLEHLTCFASFFDTVRLHLDQAGLLVLTTPNAFGVSNFVYRLGGSVRVNDDHTCWFCSDTLRQLLTKNCFAVDSITYLREESSHTARRKLANSLRALLPDRLAWNTIVATAKPV